jgi:dolichol-phosphate mannosyltransferase
LVMDGDLQHPPELALWLAGVGRSRDLDIVVASRHIGDHDAGAGAARVPGSTGSCLVGAHGRFALFARNDPAVDGRRQQVPARSRQ